MSSPQPPTPPQIIGLLGGIAAGKSVVARLLAGAEGWTVSADELAHEILRSDELTQLVTDHFGVQALGNDGRPDRAALARLVFDPENGEEARAVLEGWTHPRVRARILGRIEQARAAGVPRVALDVPLLLENDEQHGLVASCHALVFVDAADDVRDRRAQHTRGWAPGEVARREAAQLPLAEKRERADLVIPNNGEIEELERAVARALAELGPA